MRLACYLAGASFFSALTILGYLNVTLATPAYSVVVLALLCGALALLFLACRSSIPRRLRALLPYSPALMALWLAGAMWASSYSIGDIARYPAALADTTHYWNDAVAMTDCSTDLFLRGHNPYKDFSLGACFARLHMDGRFTTPLQAGEFAGVDYPQHDLERLLFAMAQQGHVRHPPEFESYVSYPAGSFLLPVVFYALGWRQMAGFYIACLVAAYLLLAGLAPARLRPWLVPIALANVIVWDYAPHGYSEGLVVLLTLAAWAAWRRPWLSTLLMGLAVATRQDAWLFALFYLVLILRANGPGAAARRAGAIAAIFVATNAPFVAQSPADWLAGVLGPLRDPMWQGGQGLIVLVQGGWLPLWPRPVYTILEAAALVACLLLYARICRRHPGTGVVLALVPLVFAWRSLFVYFYLPLPILCLWPLLDDLRTRGAQQGVVQLEGFGRCVGRGGRPAAIARVLGRVADRVAGAGSAVPAEAD